MMADFWKVIGTDNLDRESVADTLLCEKITETQAVSIADVMNAGHGENAYYWYVAVPQDHRLSRGMEDLVV